VTAWAALTVFGLGGMFSFKNEVAVTMTFYQMVNKLIFYHTIFRF